MVALKFVHYITTTGYNGSIFTIMIRMMLFNILDLIGTAAFAISGALAAIEHRMDFSGAIVLGFLVGNGGGTIRDLLLGRPIFWMQHQWDIWTAIIAAAAAFLIVWYWPHHHRKKYWDVPLLYFDALGLGAFTITGCQIALGLHHDMVISIMMGLITALGGGILRDVLCREIPIVFRGILYATPAFLGALLYVLAVHHLASELAAILGCVVIIVIRLLAIQLNWHLPFVKQP